MNFESTSRVHSGVRAFEIAKKWFVQEFAGVHGTILQPCTKAASSTILFCGFELQLTSISEIQSCSLNLQKLFMYGRPFMVVGLYFLQQPQNVKKSSRANFAPFHLSDIFGFAINHKHTQYPQRKKKRKKGSTKVLIFTPPKFSGI